MLTQAIHQDNAVLSAALRGTHARHDAIMNNIANADVPGFTARRVEFESALSEVIDNWRATGNLDLSRARPSLRYQEAFNFFRMDRSNVDMEREMVALYINSVRSDVLVNSILHNSRMLNQVLQGR
ncbi:MAG: flagellar basal body protein [Defluviitaleaceae bacterium]|nr:flagellar basal body protein [Defluviitaleaceae bacterium]